MATSMLLAALAGLIGYHGWRFRVERARAEEIARARPDLPTTRQATPRITILVAAWNAGAEFESHLRSVLRLRYPDIEYIVCAGGRDGTEARAREILGDRGMVVPQVPGDGKQGALRRALRHASGEIVYFTDADCVVSDEAIERVIAPILRGYDAATGRSRPPADQRSSAAALCQWAPQYVAESLQGEESRGLLGRNFAVTRAALGRTGDLGAEVATGTDYHLARQIWLTGGRIAFARWSFVESREIEGVRRYMRQQARWLRNHWIHGRSTGEPALARHALRAGAIGALFVLLPFLGLIVDRVMLALWFLMWVHGALARVRHVAFVCRAEALSLPRDLALVAPRYVLLDAVTWALTTVQVLVPRWRAQW